MKDLPIAQAGARGAACPHLDEVSFKGQQLSWFCVRTHPKHEHIAAAHLQKQSHMDVYLPRLRFKRSFSGGPEWITEVMFPGYIFARFGLASARLVTHTAGVAGIVHFGDYWPSIPDKVLHDLRSGLGPDGVHVICDDLMPGDIVVISGGALHNLNAVVTRIMPAKQRVVVLLNLLGRMANAELPSANLVKESSPWSNCKPPKSKGFPR